MIHCPNFSNPEVKSEFEELVDVVGEGRAYDIWNRNKGNPIDKAPNGKPSKLFKDLLELFEGNREEALEAKAKVYSPEFFGWFGDWVREDDLGNVSKVVDNNGEPLIVYHGTNEEFDRFDSTKKRYNVHNIGIFFTDSTKKANKYGEVQMPVYINSKDLEKINFLDKTSNFKELRELENTYLDNTTADGVQLTTHDKEGFNTEQTVVFNSNQIKSVFNEGEFSNENENIYHQLDENYESKIISESELLPPDPKLWKKLDKFLKKAGFSINILNNIDCNYVAKTDMVKKIIDVVDGKADITTLPEESGHIFTEMLGDDSPLLIKMMKDITSFKGFNAVREKYKHVYFKYDENNNKSIDEDKIKKEAIGKIIAQEIVREFNNESSDNKTKLLSWVKRVLKWLKTRFKSGSSDVFDAEVSPYRDIALKILRGETPENISKISNTYSPEYVKSGVMYYQLDEDAKNIQEKIIANLKKAIATKDSEGYKRLDGTKIPKRVTDYVNRFYNRIFGEPTPSPENEAMKMKGSYIHKLVELIIKDIITIDNNQTKPMDNIIKEVRAKLRSDKKIFKIAAKELIEENSDFEGMKEDDKFFILGKPGRQNNPIHSDTMWMQLVDLGLAKYRNIKDKQAAINEKTGTKGKFVIFNELIVSDNETGGTIDLAVVYSNGAVGIYDWKGVRFKTYKDKVIVEGVEDYKEKAWEVQIRQYKRILYEQYGVTNFAETRMVPINLQVDFNNPMSGIYNIEAGNRSGDKTYLNEVPVDDELIGDEVEGSEYLNKSLQKLFKKRDDLRDLIKSTHGGLKEQAELSRVKKVIKGIQLRKEFQLVIDEMRNLVKEFDNREVHKDVNNKLELEDVTRYGNYAFMFKEVLSDMFVTIENDEKLKNNAALVLSDLDSFTRRLSMKTVDLIYELTGQKIDEASVEESMMGRNFKSLYNMNNPAFKVMRQTVGENQEAIRRDFSKIEKIISDKTKKLSEWAKNKGLSLQDAFDKIVVKVNNDLKLASKFNSVFFEEIKEARAKNNKNWFKENTLIKEVNGKLEYVGKAKERFNRIKSDKFSNLEKLYSGEDQAKTLAYEKTKWINKFDITENEDALYNEKNYFILMQEKDKYMSDFWKNANESGNEALREYYEMYTSYNEEFADLTGAEINNRFVANITKDLIDSVGENGIFGFNKIAGMLKKAIEVRQYDSTKGTTINGEIVKSIPLMFLDQITGEVSKKDIKKIKEDIEAIKNEKGEQKYTGLALEDKVSSEVIKLSKERGSVHKSKDLSRSLLLFANSALTHHHLRETETMMQSILYYLKSGAGYHHPTDKLGRRKKDEFDNLLPAIPGIPSKEVELYEKFMDAIWYGQKTQGKDKLLEIGGKSYSLTKATQSFMKYISVKALGLNIFVAAGSMINTYANIMMSGVEGNIFKGAIRKSLELIKSDKKKFLAAGALFETFAHDEKYEKANRMSSSTLAKYLTSDNIYALMKYPDMMADYMMLIGMMHNYGVVDGKLVKFDNNDNANSLINLMEYNKEIDEWSIKGMSQKDFAAFRQAVLQMSYKIKGTRAENNLSATDLTLATQAAMQFRNWMPGVIENRFGELKYDEVLMDFNQGRFLVMLNELHGNIADKAKALFRLSKEVLFIKSFNAESGAMNKDAAIYYFTKFIAENPQYKGKLTIDQFLKMREGKLRGLAFEVRSLLMLKTLLYFMGMFMFGGDDDKKENKIKQFVNRNAFRMTNRGLLELSFFFDPAATFRSFYISPIALFKPIMDLGKVYKNTIDEMTDEIYGENAANDKTGWLYYSQDYIPFTNQGIKFFDPFGTWNYETYYR